MPPNEVWNLFKRWSLFPSLRDRSLFKAGGGPGSKVGGHRKYFKGERVGIEKILRSPEGASKYFPLKIFAADAPSFVSSQYPYELQSNLQNIHNNYTLKYMDIFHQEWASKNCRAMSSGPRKFSIARRVGRENFSCKKSFEPGPPGHK